MKRKLGMKTLVLFGIALLMVALPLLVACSGDEEAEQETETAATKETSATQEATPEEKWVKMLDLTDLTGPVGGILTPISEGLKAYFSHMNDAGGIDGVKVEWVVVDTQYNPAVAQSSYERMKEDSVLVLSYAFMMDWFVEVSKRDKKVIFSASPTPGAFFPAQPYMYSGAIWGPDTSAAGIQWYKDNVYQEDRPMKVAFIYTDAPAGKGYILGVPSWCTE
ncbi:MAG: ABC transporter substrate-binding protein, partial [Chloroflexota bacterium]|nr:ABC transporter substrate-binding protein [Chloroflexota bacterium]